MALVYRGNFLKIPLALSTSIDHLYSAILKLKILAYAVTPSKLRVTVRVFRFAEDCVYKPKENETLGVL